MSSGSSLPGWDHSGATILEGAPPPRDSIVYALPPESVIHDVDPTAVSRTAALERALATDAGPLLQYQRFCASSVPEPMDIVTLHKNISDASQNAAVALASLQCSARAASSSSAPQKSAPAQVQPAVRDLLSVEHRLAALEALIGSPSEAGAVLGSGTLCGAVAQLEAATSLCDPVVLRDVTAAAAEVEKVSAQCDARRTAVASSGTDAAPLDLEKLTTCYNLLRTASSLQPLVPSVVARLISLKSVHDSAAKVSERLTSAEDALEQCTRDFDDAAAHATQIETSVANTAPGLQYVNRFKPSEVDRLRHLFHHIPGLLRTLLRREPMSYWNCTRLSRVAECRVTRVSQHVPLHASRYL